MSLYGTGKLYTAERDVGTMNIKMNKNWKRMFLDRILQRGKAYYDSERVDELRQREEGKYSVLVYGNKPYSVDIIVRMNGHMHLFCTCPYANDGNRCKHMAAVMYAIEAEGELNATDEKEKRIVSKQAYPFGRSETGEYYDFAKITGTLVFAEKAVADARMMIETGRIRLRYFKLYGSILSGDRAKVCDCKGQYVSDNNEAYDIDIIFTREKVLRAFCNVEGCPNTYMGYYGYDYGREKEMCSHETALFLLAEEHIKRHNIGDATDYGGQRLLLRYRDMRGVRKAASLDTGRLIHIEPRIEIGEFGQLSTAFKIGAGKLYMIKNMSELVEKTERNETLKLGKNESLSFASDSFTEEARKYFDFICRELKGELLRDYNSRLTDRYNTEPGCEEIKGSMPLYGRRLDDFFELVKDKRVQYVSKRGREKIKGEMGFGEADPRLELEVSPVMGENGFEGIHLGGVLPQLTKGIDNQYFFDGSNLNRTGNEYMNIVELLKSGCYNGEVDITVGKNSLSEFYYRVLPMLRDYASVAENNKALIEENLSPEGEFLFKLDAPDGDVTCEAMVKYGEGSFRLHDPDMGMVKRAEISRDIVREHEVVEAIEGWLPYRDKEEKLYCCDCDEALIYDFINSGVNALLKLGEVEATDSFKRLNVRKAPRATVGVQLERDLVNLNVISDDLSQNELLDVINSYRKKRKFHRLRNGDFVNVDDENLQELSDMLETMKISPEDFVNGKPEIPVYRALYLEKMAERSGSFYMKRDSRFRKLIKEFKTVEESDYEIPEALQGIMREYQEFGYKWLRTIESYGFGGILADDMGLGKTLQMISLLLDAKKAGRLSTALIVTPASMVYNWKEEFARFAPEMRVRIIAGTRSEREKLLADAEDWDVLKDLPDKIKELQYVAFDKNQKHVYDGQVLRIRESLEAQNDESFRIGKLQILAELTRIRQICCDPSLCLENYRGESAKRQACIELVKNAIDGGCKILLFSQFTSMFELLEKDFVAEGIEYYETTGTTGKEGGWSW